MDFEHPTHSTVWKVADWNMFPENWQIPVLFLFDAPNFMLHSVLDVWKNMIICQKS